MNFRELQRVIARFGRAASRPKVSRRDDDVVSRLWSDESGQDLIEYMLLAAFIGLVGVVAFQVLGATMKNVYEGWDSNVQNQWEMPPPAASGY